MDAKEIRAKVEEVENRINSRTEMFYEEIKNTRKDFQELSSLYDELAKAIDDPIFEKGCQTSWLELRQEIRKSYDDISSKLKSLY